MEGRTRVVACTLLVLSVMGMLAGCAEWSESSSSSPVPMRSSAMSLGTTYFDDEGDPVTRSVQIDPATNLVSPAEAGLITGPVDAYTPLFVAAGEGTRAERPPDQGTQEERVVDDLYDPFQKPGDQPADIEEYDPWESFNVAIFNFNRKVDKYVLKPVATVYDKVVPDVVELGIRRFFHNVRFVPRLLNNLFQGKFKGAGLEMGRFLVNSTLGLAGSLDFAKEVFGWETPDEDFGQTLGAY